MLKTALALIVTVAACTAVASAQGARLQQALDKPIDLVISDAPIETVFERLSQASGAPIVVDPDTIAALPYGQQTHLAVELRSVTLRKALTPMLAPQALEWVVQDDQIRIVPTEALYRLNRRATYDELVSLGRLHSQQLKPVEQAGPILDQMRQITGEKDLDFSFHAEIDKDAAMRRAQRVLPASAAQYLDLLCHGQGCTWFLSGDRIMVLERVAQVRRQLEKQVSLRYQNAGLVTALLDLARQARVQIQMDPGVLNMLPHETQHNFNLMMSHASIAQALEVISGATGLEFQPTAQGILVEASENLKAAQGQTTQRPRRPFFLRMTVPLTNGESAEVWLSPDELPSDVQERILQRRDEAVQRLREQLPQTQPAGD